MPGRTVQALAMATVSAAVIALQVVLLRALSVIGYYHFAYLVIGTALLGFGASGTALALMWRRVKGRSELWGMRALGMFAVTAALSYPLAAVLRPDVHYLLYSAAEAASLVLEIVVLFLPFFFAGWFVGLLLSSYPARAGRLYAANLVGSGGGGLLGIGALFLIPASSLPQCASIIAALTLLLWLAARPGGTQGAAFGTRRERIAWISLSLAAAASSVLFLKVGEAPFDQYKEIARLERLRAQGSAVREAGAFGPRGRLDVYSAETLHSTLFASPTGTTPPPQLSILRDGNGIGTAFRIDTAQAAEVLDSVPQSLPYRLVERPRVLLLGEVGGVNVWLARRFGAGAITVVQTNPQLVRLLRRDLGSQSGGVYDGSDVKVVTKNPRLFLEQTTERFDIIQFADSEGMPAGSGGLGSLSQDYLLTKEAFAAAFSRLTARGMIAVTRGVHIPPRDNIRILSTIAAGIESALSASESSGEPARHITQLRNYLAMTTMAARAPWQADQLPELRRLSETLLLDIEHYPGLAWGERQQRNAVPGPPDVPYSYFHHAAKRILNDDARTFYADWVYDVRPASDDEPYFHSFFKWSSLPSYVESFGRDWFRRIDLGHAVVTVTFVEVTVLALLLVLVPVLLHRRRSRSVGRPSLPPLSLSRALLHFVGIGFGFIFLEILFIQKLTRFMGDPIYSTAAVLTGIMLFAGVGSALQGRSRSSAKTQVTAAAALLVAVGALYMAGLDPLLSRLSAAPTLLRFAITVAVLLPVSVPLGFFFPAGVAYLRERDPDAVPLGWAANGVASVSATPLSLLLSIAFGFQLLFALALLLYTAVALSARSW